MPDVGDLRRLTCPQLPGVEFHVFSAKNETWIGARSSDQADRTIRTFWSSATHAPSDAAPIVDAICGRALAERRNGTPLQTALKVFIEGWELWGGSPQVLDSVLSAGWFAERLDATPLESVDVGLAEPEDRT